jgi:hypothetical protein
VALHLHNYAVGALVACGAQPARQHQTASWKCRQCRARPGAGCSALPRCAGQASECLSHSPATPVPPALQPAAPHSSASAPLLPWCPASTTTHQG